MRQGNTTSFTLTNSQISSVKVVLNYQTSSFACFPFLHLSIHSQLDWGWGFRRREKAWPLPEYTWTLTNWAQLMPTQPCNNVIQHPGEAWVFLCRVWILQVCTPVVSSVIRHMEVTVCHYLRAAKLVMLKPVLNLTGYLFNKQLPSIMLGKNLALQGILLMCPGVFIPNLSFLKMPKASYKSPPQTQTAIVAGDKQPFTLTT